MVIGRSRNEEQQEKWKQSARYWKALPLRSTLLFLGAIFCLFACFGFLASIFNMRETNLWSAALWAVNSGIFATLWAFSGTRRNIKLMIATGLTQAAVNISLPTFLDRRFPASIHYSVDSRLQRILVTDAALTLSLILLGYICFVAFTGGEARRVYAAFTELKLANEIHRTLVPPIEQKFDGYEIAALSIPSGSMGGDLVDVARTEKGWLAYLADVSGHGVAAGITMSMVKSAVHTHAVDSGDAARLLPTVNSVLTTVSPPATLVTFAMLNGDSGPNLTLSLAGHLPVLHYRRKAQRVEEESVLNFPLAAFPESQFDSVPICCECGDIIAVVSDGLTETADRSGNELGLDPLKKVLLLNSERPLLEIVTLMRNEALKFGEQRDDQSVLLIRRSDEGHSGA